MCLVVWPFAGYGLGGLFNVCEFVMNGKQCSGSITVTGALQIVYLLTCSPPPPHVPSRHACIAVRALQVMSPVGCSTCVSL